MYDAIQSVLEQDYPQIELVVSDDGSANFPDEELRAYIAKNKRQNIKSVIIRTEECNVGTVKHLNHAISFASGNHIFALAGDDVFHDNSVLSRYTKGFEKAGTDCYLLMSQVAMYDDKLEKLQGYFVGPTVQKVLEKDVPGLDLFNILSVSSYLPSTGTVYRKEFFEKFGKFDETYFLVEDYPMHIQLALDGWKIHYENFISIDHRHGGISKGNAGGASITYIRYLQDLKKVIQEKIIPNQQLLKPEVRKRIIKKNKSDCIKIDYIAMTHSGKLKSKLQFCCMHPLFALAKLLIKAASLFRKFRYLAILGLILMSFHAQIAHASALVLNRVFSGLSLQGNLPDILFQGGFAVFLIGVVSFIIYYSGSFLQRAEGLPHIYLQ